ncbi:hypothetical protein [Enterovirga aerilata]|uniref:hypothetical protein n=1 Tax=Enterovirga aerilata TaxID=2730920 RepID=UPI0015828B52|nr:hypothetical protein [Enterovirga sp. DB1703]
MSVFLALLGIAMMVSGLAAIYSGSLFVGIERGWTMVVSGTVSFSAGALLLGLAAALRRLKRIERATKRLAGTFGTFRPVTLEAEPASVAPQPEPAAAPQVQDKESEPAGAAASGEGLAPGGAPRSAAIVGTYQAGGNSYVMYADGSIRAETPSGEHRFASMDEFKAFMMTGTMRAGAPDEPGKIPASSAPAQAKPTALSAKA